MTTRSPCPVCNHSGSFAYQAYATGETTGSCYDYFCCSNCGLLYQHPMPNEKEIASFYPDSYGAYCEPTRVAFSRREISTLRQQLSYTHLPLSGKRKFFDFLRGPKPVPSVPPWVPGGRVLDVGCGNGEYLLRMQSIGWDCHGVEFGRQGVAVCRENGLDVFHGGLLEAGFESDSFDLVTAHHFIEHVPSPADIMTEMVRITKPGGHILLRTPNNAALGRRWFGPNWYANGVPGHVLLFSEKSLEHLACSHGLELVQRYRPIEQKFILKSLDLKHQRQGATHGKLAKWLAKLYIPAARLIRQGDELFDIYLKPKS